MCVQLEYMLNYYIIYHIFLGGKDEATWRHFD